MSPAQKHSGLAKDLVLTSCGLGVGRQRGALNRLSWSLRFHYPQTLPRCWRGRRQRRPDTAPPAQNLVGQGYAWASVGPHPVGSTSLSRAFSNKEDQRLLLGLTEVLGSHVCARALQRKPCSWPGPRLLQLENLCRENSLAAGEEVMSDRRAPACGRTSLPLAGVSVSGW